jgi:creatinine amidohydrolase
MHLADLTWPEVQALDRETPVVVPFAAIEQHGPHLPIGTDTYITEGILWRLEARAPESALWLPVERFGSSPHHMPFPGTVTLSSRTFLDVAREVVESFAEHGFRRFLLLNGHGGNQALLNVAVQEVRLGAGRIVPAPGARELRVVHATYWTIAREAFARVRESAPGGMGHACEMETSIMLALRPELVKRELAVADGDPPRSRFDHRDMLEPASVGQFRFWDEWSRRGPIGDPSTASAEKGQRFLDAAVDALIELLGELRKGGIG